MCPRQDEDPHVQKDQKTDRQGSHSEALGRLAVCLLARTRGSRRVSVWGNEPPRSNILQTRFQLWGEGITPRTGSSVKTMLIQYFGKEGHQRVVPVVGSLIAGPPSQNGWLTFDSPSSQPQEEVPRTKDAHTQRKFYQCGTVFPLRPSLASLGCSASSSNHWDQLFPMVPVEPKNHDHGFSLELTVSRTVGFFLNSELLTSGYHVKSAWLQSTAQSWGFCVSCHVNPHVSIFYSPRTHPSPSPPPPEAHCPRCLSPKGTGTLW